MWPWGHLAVGYLLYSAATRLGNDRPPRGAEAGLVAVATLLPDLVDKPFAWTVPLLPNGRSLAHSLLFAALIVIATWVYFRQRERPELAAAFGVGYLSHLLADAFQPLVTGEFHYLGFLGWPLVPAIEYGTDPSFAAHFAGIEFTPFFAFQLALVLLALIEWVYDGTPGLRNHSIRIGQFDPSDR